MSHLWESYASDVSKQPTSDSVMKRLDDPSSSLAASLFNTSVFDSVGKTDVASLPNTSSRSKTRSSLQTCQQDKPVDPAHSVVLSVMRGWWTRTPPHALAPLVLC